MKPDIQVIEGFRLNPNQKIVNSVMKLIEKNNGFCICDNKSEDPKCPCTDYRINKLCHCKLYIKDENS